jgi:predicted O-methyltransferase YrrM
VLGMECKSVFEFGAGQSTKAILGALMHTGGYLVSCDLRPLDAIEPLGEGFDDTYWDRWIFLQGDSRDIASNLSCEFGPYDLVLCDGSHVPEDVIGDIRDIVPQMRRDSLMLIHDTEHPDIDYGLGPAVEEALANVAHSTVRLPVGDGLDIVRIEEDFGHGSVELDWRKRKAEQTTVSPAREVSRCTFDCDQSGLNERAPGLPA